MADSGPNETKFRIQTASGLYYHFLEPTAEMIALNDIAHHLAGTFRFSGATDPWISVAEHSVAVSRLVPDEFKGGALFHDGSEAYLWDLPRPAKPLYGKTYAELTQKCDAVIGEKLGIDPDQFHDPVVKAADDTMLNYEGNIGLPHWSEPKPELGPMIDWTIGLPPAQAKRLFLQEAIRLGYGQKVDYAPPLPELKQKVLEPGSGQLSFEL